MCKLLIIIPVQVVSMVSSGFLKSTLSPPEHPMHILLCLAKGSSI